MAKQLTIPGGTNKGMPLTEAPDKDLEFWAEKCRIEEIRLGAAEELRRRRAGGAAAAAQPKPQPNDASRAARGELVTGAFRDPQKATEALRRAQDAAHLVAPATVCATLPEGTEIALAAVFVAVDTETYSLPGGKLGLGKTALDRIAAAAGVDWDPRLSGRLDDGYDPHYCHYRAVGAVRTFDGSIRTITGEVEIDARDGSPQIDEICTKARNSDPPRDPRPQILELRKFLLRHAESKAKNRAIRSLGLQTAYSREELKKPFVVAKPMFTGSSDDPEARREFRAAIADSYLGNRNRLYPTVPETREPAQRPSAQAHGHQAPPLGAVPIDTDYTNVSPRGEFAGKPADNETAPAAIDPDQPVEGSTEGDDIPY